MHTAFEKVMGVPLGGSNTDGLKEQADRVEDLYGILNSWQPYSYDTLPYKADEKAYMDRAMPTKTKRYTDNKNLFKEWKRGVGV